MDHLKQDLPHFGDNGEAELEDLIEICDRESDDDHYNEGNRRRMALKRIASKRQLTKLGHRRGVTLG